MRNKGIYKITNTINGNFYIGSSSNIRKRKEKHFRSLKNDTHENIHLQRAFNKYGEKSFTFEVIEYTDDLLTKEQELLNEHYGNSYFYNICPVAGSPSVKGRTKSKEHRQKLSESIKKYYEENPHHRQKLSVIKKGKKLSDETKKKMSDGHKKGSSHHNSKLTEEEVLSIKAKYSPRIYSYGKLAKEYGVDKKTIIRIIQGKTWSHNQVIE